MMQFAEQRDQSMESEQPTPAVNETPKEEVLKPLTPEEREANKVGYNALMLEIEMLDADVAQLVQVNRPDINPQKLSERQLGFNTGPMSDCISVVACWQSDNGSHNCIGQHGGGGLGNINIEAFANSIKGDPATKRLANLTLRILPGTSYIGDKKFIDDKAIPFARQLQEACGDAKMKVTVTPSPLRGHCQVSKQGDIVCLAPTHPVATNPMEIPKSKYYAAQAPKASHRECQEY